MNRNKQLLFFFVFVLLIGEVGLAKAQAPSISYISPQVYKPGNVISPLAPVNKGGAIPATTYGQVTTFAGSSVHGNTDGQGVFASFNYPVSLTIDNSGNLFIADEVNNLIRKITPSGAVTTFAGSGAVAYADGNGTSAAFSNPTGITIDAAGNIYVADDGNNRIRKITPADLVSTIADVNGLGYNNILFGITVDGSGNIFVVDDAQNLIKKVDLSAQVTTIAGNGSYGTLDGNGTNSSFFQPKGIVSDNTGNLYIADQEGYKIRKITSTGVVSTFAGNGTPGSTNGIGSVAEFSYPTGLTIDKQGNVYIADQTNNLIRKITPSGLVSTIAGSTTAGNADGIGSAAGFYNPTGVALDGSGNLFVADLGNNIIRKILLTGYTIDKPLPAGLLFDPTIGTVSGTPTAASPATDYTITAYNASGSSSTILNIKIGDDAILPSIITFPPPETNTVDANNNITPGATSTNTETPITYTSSNPAVAVIINGLIHLVGPGVTNITASQAGNADYSAANPVIEILTVIKEQVITFPAFGPTGTCTADFNAGATSSNPTLPLIYNSSNTAVATVSAQGLIHIVGAGSTTITVSQPGNNLYATATPKSQVLTVMAPVVPMVFISANNASVCAGTRITFTATVTNGNNDVLYQWQINGVNVLGNSAVISFNTISPSDVIQCVVTNGGICPVSATSNVLTNLNGIPYITPSVTIKSSASGSVCAGTPITFTASPSNGGSSPAYQWQVNGTNAGTSDPVFASSSLSDGDVITCRVTNTTSPCLTVSTALSNSIKVSITPLSTIVPTVTVSPGFFSSCQNLSVTYTASVTNAGNSPAYQWQVNGQNAGTNMPTFTSSTLNTGDKITCIVTSSIACSTATATSNVASIEADPQLSNSISITSSVASNILAANQQVTFTATAGYTASGTTTVSYQWQVNNINEGTDSPTFTTSSLINGDEVTCILITYGKCIATPTLVSNALKFIVITPVVIKNTFTPNGDGVNDTWNIPSLAAYPGCSVRIFTRYGTLVYNSIGYPKAWDGTYNNSNLPTGTYYYVIDLKNGEKPLSGFIALLR